MCVTDRYDMTLAVKVALNPNLLISLRPYNNHAYNSDRAAPSVDGFGATRTDCHGSSCPLSHCFKCPSALGDGLS